MNDHLSDMLARIKNAYLAGKKTVVLPSTKLLVSVAQVLVDNKYLAGIEQTEDGKMKNLICKLNYYQGSPALRHAKMVSKPGVRNYKKSSALKPILAGMGIAVLSTNKGIMSDQDARKHKIGGEVLMELW